MPFVATIEPEESDGLLKEQYQWTFELMSMGTYPNLVRAWSLQPEVAASWLQFGRLARERAGLNDRQYEVLLCRVAYNLKCEYVVANHACLLHRQGDFSEDELVEIITNGKSSSLTSLESALLDIADLACSASHKVRRRDIDSLRSVGFSDAQITALAFLIGWLTTDAIIPNILGAEPDQFSQHFRRRLATW